MVGLRSRTHLHYIRAIKNRSIVIVTNVDARRNSKLKIRQLVDVYNQKNIKDNDSIPRIQIRDLDNVSETTRGSYLFGPKVNVKTEPEDFNMTLDMIRRQCLEKKRKLRNHRDSETASLYKVKQEYLTLHTEDGGCDLEEPLCNLNTKFSKRRKKNQECKTKRGSTSSSSVKKALSVFCDVKPETCENSYSVSEAMEFISTDSLLNCNKESESPPNTDFVEESMYDSSQGTRPALYCTPGPIAPGMVVIEESITTKPVDETFTDVSEEFNYAGKIRCCLADNIALENQETVLHGSVSREEAEFEVPQNSESEIISCFPISSNTSSDYEEVKEDEKNNTSEPSLGITGLEIVKIEAPDVLASDRSDLTTIGFGVKSNEIVWETEEISEDDLPEKLTSSCNSVNLHSVSDDSTISLEEHQLPKRLQEHPASSGNVGEAEDYKLSKLYKAPDEVTTNAEADRIHLHRLPNQPEKLFSKRKALSPTSQAKLRKAMEHPDSLEKRSKKSKGKLYFNSQNSHRILKAQGLDNIDRVDFIPNSKQAIQRANNNIRQLQYQKATHKFPRRETQATKPQPFSSGCTSLLGCTQKAIDFSQGQMRDFQYVAAKLTEEIKSMRQITKRCLLADNNMSECNFDEVKTLIRNAERSEENSKKWLSIIERDCNRFCKLMGMVTEDSPVTENIVHKKKKIRFADDAGGNLCHVKVFEIDFESES